MSAHFPQAQNRPLNPATRENITVEPARVHVSVRLTDSLVAYGIGGCICICLYDYRRKVAGMAHVTLPSAEHFKDREVTTFNQPARFVDQAIPVLLDLMHKAGCTPANMKAAIVGGSRVSRAAKSVGSIPQLMQFGNTTLEEAIEILEEAGVRITGKDIGGSRGRTVALRVCDGCVISKPTASDAIVVAMLNIPGEEIAA